jgi:CHAD domain-containing protein
MPASWRPELTTSLPKAVVLVKNRRRSGYRRVTLERRVTRRLRDTASDCDPVYAALVRETVEREVKLAPGEGFSMPELGGETLPARSFVSTYHDTSDFRLARHHVTFRHRVEDGTGLWQLKIPRGDARLEIERSGPPAVPPADILLLLPALLRGAPLGSVARMRTRRQVTRVPGAEIADDAVSVLDGQHVVRRFHELEVELVDGGDEVTLRRLVKTLRRAGADGGPFRPKLYRALELEPPSEPIVPRRSSPAAALTLRLQGQAATLVQHDPGTRLGSDPEDLHQLRVATRRLRAFLRAGRQLLELEPAEALRGELGWLGSALGPARDLDVLIERFAAEAEAVGGEAHALVAALEARRVDARTTLLDALGSGRYLRLLDRLDGFVASPPLSGGEQVRLAAIWWKETKKLRRAVAALPAEPRDEELHAVRNFVKRSRYAAELAAHELGERGVTYVERSKLAQDVLGDHQDATVGIEQIRRWAGDREELLDVAGQLVARQEARKVAARARWPAVWAKLDRAARRAHA